MKRLAPSLCCLLVLLTAAAAGGESRFADGLPSAAPPPPLTRGARADTLWLFAPDGLGAYGEAGVTTTGYNFDGTGECFEAGWTGGGGPFPRMRENIYTPGENESCLWTFFDPDTTEPGYPMGVFPYGPPYYELSIGSPPLEVDADGQGFTLADGEGQLFLRYSVYSDLPLNALIFHYPLVAARRPEGDYGAYWHPSLSVFYGEDGWVDFEFDLTAAAFDAVGGPDYTVAGVKVRLMLVDMCPELCGIYGSGYPHTISAFFDDVQIGIVRDLTAAPESPQPVTALAAPQPNPFNPSTQIRFALAAAGPARLSVCDLAGRRCRLLLDEELPAGERSLSWDGKDDRGGELASGVYFLRLETATGSYSQKAVLLR